MKTIILIVCVCLVQAAAQVKATRAHSLDEARTVLRNSGDLDVGSVHVNAAKLVMEVNVPHDRILLALKGSSGGALALYKSDGALADSVKIGDAISYQNFDPGEDASLDILLDEVEGSGTSVLLRQFKLYAVTEGDHVTEIWHAPSFSRKAPWSSAIPEPRVRIERGYLAFSRAGAGYPAQMSYAFCDAQGHWKRKDYRVTGGRVELLK